MKQGTVADYGLCKDGVCERASVANFVMAKPLNSRGMMT